MIHPPNPNTHPDWLAPHSLAWYTQLGEMTGEYVYPWRSTITEPNGESLFMEEITRMVPNQSVLDIGCGHGAFTLHWSPSAKEIVGLDVTEKFVKKARTQTPENVSFVITNTKNTLPFPDDTFDFAYNRKGPTSAYPDITRVVKKGGAFIGLHPGDQLSAELFEWFPHLFGSPPAGSPILQNLQERIKQADFYHVDIQTVVATEYFQTPLDVIRMRCFGQSPTILTSTIEQHMESIMPIFDHHATADGLPTTHMFYLVRAIV
ncbi:class I SAM-dependent methyltransferase [Brevibacillus sp. 179-C9.3 HS]|uniref:class I SAM-dependent methyltransferase n=1 Tax=unclassified Brevibacillus TaxID=2684853 RepID=UPI0039A3CC44